jgi:hypothetical protein
MPIPTTPPPEPTQGTARHARRGVSMPAADRATRACLPALLCLLAWPGSAAAQEDALIGTTPDRGSTVMDRPRPEVDPVGVRLGGFRLDAEVFTGLGYSTNLLGTSSGQISGGFLDYGARASIVSDWTENQIGVRGGVANRNYIDNSNLDTFVWDAGVFGRWDAASNLAITGGYTHSRLAYAVQSVDVQQAGISEPVPYDVDEFNIGAVTAFNRVALGVSANYQMYRYQDVPGPNGDIAPFDFNSLTLGVDTGYELVEGRSITLGLRYQNVDHPDSAASDRNSQTYAALVGFRYDFDGIWSARVAIGYAHREYEGSQFKSFDTPAAEINVTWNPTALTTVNLTVGRSIQESIRENAASYISSAGRLRVDHELFRNIIVSGWVGLEGAEYEQPSQEAVQADVGAAVLWLMNRHLATSFDVMYNNRFRHTNGLQGYENTTFYLRLRFSL